MRKILFPILFLVLAGSLLAQPQYYNYQNVGTSSNTYPFGQAPGKQVQWLFLAGDFNQPTPLPAGNEITKVYFFMTGTGSRTYTSLTIKLGQATISSLPTGSVYTGPLDTVYYKASVTLSATTLTWMSITLDTPYPYDPSKSLILDVSQCGAPGTDMYVRQTTLTGNRRNYLNHAGSCIFTWQGQNPSVVNFGVDVQPVGPPPGPVPEIIYYKFEDNPTPTTVTNYAIPGQGSNPASLSGAITLTSGGQFDSCIIGTTGASNGGVVTGWNNSLGSGSWTISTWINLPTDPTGLAYYIFGDAAGSFRCFHNGVAGPNNLVLRGTGILDVLVTGVGPTPTVVHFVYDSAASEVKTYKNGIYNTTVSQAPLNLAPGTGFKVGGYSTTRTMKAKLDEFRVYSRALDTTEISLTWNHQLPLVTGIPTPVLNMPDKFVLSQNYPNPFNPTTTIEYKTPTKGLVILKVYDILGKEITTLVNEVKNAGSYTVEFNGSNLPSGTYFYRLEAGDNLDVKKMILLK